MQRHANNPEDRTQDSVSAFFQAELLLPIHLRNEAASSQELCPEVIPEMTVETELWASSRNFVD